VKTNGPFRESSRSEKMPDRIGHSIGLILNSPRIQSERRFDWTRNSIGSRLDSIGLNTRFGTELNRSGNSIGPGIRSDQIFDPSR
jgi:hypothetical protein